MSGDIPRGSARPKAGYGAGGPEGTLSCPAVGCGQFEFDEAYVKISLTVFWCLALLFFSLVSVGGAQEQPPATPPSDPTADQSPLSPQQTPPATPPASQPAQTPQQTPPVTTPPDQTPMGQPRIGIRQPPPPLPKVPDIRQPGETGYWISVTGWFPTETPT